MKKSESKKIENVLVILPNNLGDVIMAMPALEGIRMEYPECHISFLVEQGFEAGLESCACVDRLLRIPRKTIRDGLHGGQWQNGVGVLRDFMAIVNDWTYDLCINLSQHDYMSPLAALVKAKRVLGRRFLREGNHAIADSWSQYLYAIPFSRRSNRLHASDVFRRIAGVSRHGDRYPVSLTSAERDEAVARLRQGGIDPADSRIAVFQPGAAFPSKKWPVGHFVELGRMLMADGWTVVISGAPSETGDALMIRTALGDRCVCIAGTTTFRQAMGVLSHAAACVTPDTALMHAAAGLGIPAFALFGATSPVETGPYGNGHWIFCGGCDRRPCFDVHCQDMKCMKSILPQTVYECMTRGEPVVDPGCDIYRTSLEPDGDYRLQPISVTSFLYYDENAAAMVLKGFGEAPAMLGKSKTGVVESLLILEIIKGMSGWLDTFIEKKDPACIRRFEEGKTTLETCTGVGAFWTAVLNLALNSIPLMDVMDGIRNSVRVCKDVSRRIKSTLPDDA